MWKSVELKNVATSPVVTAKVSTQAITLTRQTLDERVKLIYATIEWSHEQVDVIMLVIYCLITILNLTLVSSQSQDTERLCPVIANCDDCTNPGLECATCEDGYWLRDLTTCVSCPSHCLKCTGGECIDCEPGYYYVLDTNECFSCSSHCDSCADSERCGMCSDSYRSIDSDVLLCIDCPVGCIRCSDSSDDGCTACMDNYFYTSVTEHEGTCTECRSFCSECSSATTCDKCNEGYTWQDSNCIRCIDNCHDDFCIHETGCKFCSEGFFINNLGTECRSCDYCLTCQAIGGCTQCLEGFVLNSDGTCQACPNIHDQSTCEQCSTTDRGRLFVDGQCDYCPLYCEQCNDVNVCDICFDGYFLLGDGCSECDSACLTCDGPAATSCLSCIEGSGLVNNECLECSVATGDLNCKSCDGAECTCDDCACASNFYQSPTPTEIPSAVCRSCASADIMESETVCTQCAPAGTGRYLSPDRCVGCDVYGPECLSCDTSGCTLCEEKYYYDATTELCEQCAQGKCIECSPLDNTVCIECKDKYWNDEGTCKECVDECISCSDSFSCDVCDEGYFVEYASPCPDCLVANCDLCNRDITSCRDCKPGFHEISITECRACDASDCIDCFRDIANCVECATGFTLLSDGTCGRCGVSSCVTCDTDAEDPLENSFKYGSNCDTCDDGLYPVDTPTCFLGDVNDHCIIYDDYDTCLICDEGYYVDTNGDCDACNTGCRTCTHSNMRSCTTCYDEYYFNVANGRCLDCIANCKTCTDGTIASCTECNDGYLSDGSACVEYTSSCSDNNCDKCRVSNTAVCIICDTTYWNNGGTCSNCITNCDTCSDASTCDDCTANWGSADCSMQCEANCEDCDDTTTCTLCMTRFGGTVNDCDVLCLSACATCTTGIACASCPAGFGGSTCSTCDVGCSACTIAMVSQCTTCEDGYYYTQDGGNAYGICTGCPVGCATCTGVLACQTCESGYTLGTDDLCHQCNTFSNCGECSVNECLRCEDGYGLFPLTVCEECESNCESCDDDTTCTECNPGYFLENDDCSVDKCEPNCDICSDDTTCQRCNTGYALFDNICEACAENCNNCNTRVSKCLSCASGFKTEAVCSSCDTRKCAACSDAATCILCDSQYYLNPVSLKCNRCPARCLQCPNGICTKCKDGFKVNGGSCARYSSQLFGCLDDDNGFCLECDVGYYIDPVTGLCGDCDDVVPDASEYVCSQCQRGPSPHENVQSWIATCEDCPTNCELCTSGDSCVSCADGYYTDGIQCYPLSCTLAAITHSVACATCSVTNVNGDGQRQGLVWDASTNRCKECPRDCEVCTSAATCNEVGESCRDSYIWSVGEGICVECAFESQEACAGCVYGNTGQYLDNTGRCLSCDEFCTGCSEDASSCTECAPSHYLELGSCLSCESADISEAGCNSCQETFEQWVDNVHAWMQDLTLGELDPPFQCLECPAGCQACETPITCDGCFPGNYFYANEDTSTYECRACIPNCRWCSGSATCSQCATDYTVVEATQTCQRCPTHCTDCSHANGCQQCEEGYLLDEENMCQLCSSLVPQCLTCSVDEGCTECAVSHYARTLNNVANGECAACLDNCYMCSDSSSCDLCDDGYCMDFSGTECHFHTGGSQCDSCKMIDSELSCLTCIAGTFLELCQVCVDDNCLKCDTSADECSSCADGWFVTDGRCSPCASRCLQCSDATSCSWCPDATYWDNVATSCRACLTDCGLCSDSDTCTTCAYENSYHVTSTRPHTCNDCISGCKMCDDGTVCLACYEAHYTVTADNGDITSCLPCSEGCKVCTDDLTCTGCYDGFVLSNVNVCLDCSDFRNCLYCADFNNNLVIDSDECIECLPGHIMSEDETECQECSISGCAICQDREYVCTDCSEGYLQTETETQCGVPCWLCDDINNEYDYECEEAPEASLYIENSVNLLTSAYSKVGCANGCMVTRNESADGIRYIRQCFPADMTCESFTTEQCMFYGDETSEIVECSICCTEEFCNIMTLTGSESGSDSHTQTAGILCIALFLYTLFVR